MSSPYLEPGEEWMYPIMSGGRWACCDCGLVHDIEFRVMRIMDQTDGLAHVVTDHSYCVGMRVKRNNRSTGQIRHHLNNIILED